MPAINWDFRYLRWLIGHMDEAESIFRAIQNAMNAATNREKVLAMHPVVDALAEIVDDFPVGFGSMTEAAEPEYAAQVRNEAEARGINWARLLEIAEKLLPFLLLFFQQEPEGTT